MGVGQASFACEARPATGRTNSPRRGSGQCVGRAFISSSNFRTGAAERRAEELAGPPLGVIGRTPWPRAGNEPDVSSSLGELQREIRVPCCQLTHLGKDVRRKKRIIDRAEQKRGYTDGGQPAKRARSGVIVVCVPKSVHWRGDGVVELEDRPGFLKAVAVEELRVPIELAQRLITQRRQEVPIVDSREALRDEARPTLEIVRDGNSRSCLDLRRQRPRPLAQRFQ